MAQSRFERHVQYMKTSLALREQLLDRIQTKLDAARDVLSSERVQEIETELEVERLAVELDRRDLEARISRENQGI